MQRKRLFEREGEETMRALEAHGLREHREKEIEREETTALTQPNCKTVLSSNITIYTHLATMIFERN